MDLDIPFESRSCSVDIDMPNLMRNTDETISSASASEEPRSLRRNDVYDSDDAYISDDDMMDDDDMLNCDDMMEDIDVNSSNLSNQYESENSERNIQHSVGDITEDPIMLITGNVVSITSTVR